MPAKTHVSRAGTNGEAKAEDEKKAKAEAEKAEAEKAAEALKVQAEANEKALGSLVEKVQNAARTLGEAELSFGRVLVECETYLPSPTYANLQAFCEAHIPEASGPMWSSSPAYRAVMAGRVEVSIGDAQGSSVWSLVFLHRFSDEDRVRVWKKAKGRRTGPISRTSLEEAASSLGLGEAKKGPKAKTPAQKKAAQKKAEKAAQAETVATLMEAIGALRPESAEVPDAAVPVVQEALGAIGKVLQGHADRFGGPEALSAADEVLRATVDLCETFTIPVVRAALRYRDEAREKAEARKAEAPKPLTNQPSGRTTRKRNTRRTRTSK